MLKKQCLKNDMEHMELTESLLKTVEDLKLENEALKKKEKVRVQNDTCRTLYQAPSTSTSRPLLLQPKHFGLDQWNASDTSILEHLENVQRCVEEARNFGCSEKSLIRLLLNTLPNDCQYLKNFIANEYQTSYESFAREVLSILGQDPQSTMVDFISCRREVCENPLAYFQRILTLYKAANCLIGDKWLNDKSHVIPIYAKYLQSLYSQAKNELRRRVESDNENLTVTSLRRHVIEVNRLGLNKENFRAETVLKSRVVNMEEGSGNSPANLSNIMGEKYEQASIAGKRDKLDESSDDEKDYDV